MLKKKMLILLIGSLAGNVASADTLNDGVVAYWNFDHCSAADISNNAYDGTISGAVECVDGVAGTRGMSFHVDNDHISAIANAGLSSKQITLSAWINPTGGGTYNPRIIAVGPSGTPSQYYSIILQGTQSKRHAWLHSGATGGSLIGAGYITDNSGWHHVAATIDGLTAKLYVDGKLDVETKKYPALKTFSTGLIQIGYSDNPIGQNDFTDQFVGGIDEVRIYNRALTAAEIRALNYQGHPPTIKGGVGWGTAHTITCQNVTQNTTVVIPSTEALAWDCEKAGLSVQSGDTVKVTITGKKY